MPSKDPPLNIYQADDRYKISGNLTLEKKSALSLKLDVIKGDLGMGMDILIKHLQCRIGAIHLGNHSAVDGSCLRASGSHKSRQGDQA